MRDRKDSGLPWVGDIPVDWNVCRGKNAVKKLKRPVKDTDGVITCFRDGEVTLRSNRREEGFTFSEQEVGYQGIEPGDLVIHGMDGFAGSIGISDSRGKGTPVLNVLDSKNDKRYLMYYFRTIAKCGYFESVATGIRVRTCDTNWNKISVTPCLVPPLVEQSRIAVFLDERCGKIDEAIAKHKALIEKLDEYRKAVITKAVTKGVKGEREMKETGVDWIGKIPSDWEKTKVKYFGVFLNGFAFKPEDWSDNGLPIIRIQDLSGSNDSPNHTTRIVPNKYIVNNGDILISWAATLDTFIWNKGKALLNQHIFKAEPKKGVDKGFFFWMMKEAMIQMRHANRHGIMMEHVTLPVFENFYLPFPPLSEQKEIVAFLDEKCAAIDSAKERHTQLIAKLEEYKKSLIYNVVTGKIEC